MDIRLQNALITKYARQPGGNLMPTLEQFSPEGNAPDPVIEAQREEFARIQNPGKTIKDQKKIRNEAAREVRVEAARQKAFAPITAAQDAAKATRIKGEEDAASAKTKGEEAAASAKTKGEEAAGRASLRGYLNPTSSPIGNMALYGGGGALLGGGLAALLSSPKNRKRNALMYALLGGGLGIGAKMLGDRYAAEPAAPAAPAEPIAKTISDVPDELSGGSIGRTQY